MVATITHLPLPRQSGAPVSSAPAADLAMRAAEIVTEHLPHVRPEHVPQDSPEGTALRAAMERLEAARHAASVYRLAGITGPQVRNWPPAASSPVLTALARELEPGS